MNIHPKAWVGDDISVGLNSKVWQFASMIRGARIGDDCNVGANATIDGAYVGDRCTIGSGAFIPPGILIFSDCFIGPNVTFCNDVWPEVSKDGFDYEKLASPEFWTIIIAPGASIGAGSIILPGVFIGESAIVAAGSVVTRNVPAGHLWKKGEVSKAERGERMRECFKP